MKIAVSADLHFGRGGDSGIEQFTRSFDEMITGMIAHEVHLAVFAGDIFEKWHHFTPRTFMVIDDRFRELARKGIDIIVLAGNHDYDISGTHPAVAPLARAGARVVTQPKCSTLEVDGQVHLFTFIPWVTKAMAVKAGINLKAPMNEIHEAIYQKIVQPVYADFERMRDIAEGQANAGMNAMFFHASVFGADMGSSRCIESVDFTLDPSRVPSGFDHVVGGHFHRRQEFKGMVYVGSMERQTFGECNNPTGWLLIEDADREFIELETSQKFIELSYDLTVDGNIFSSMIQKIKLTDLSNSKVKLKYRIGKNDAFDRAAVIRELQAAGATSIVFDPEYIDEIQSRTHITADLGILEQFQIWRDANPDKDVDGSLFALFEKERMAAFPDVITQDHIRAMLNGGGAK